jgi:acetyl esterase/lipase
VQLKVWDELWHIFPIHVGHMPEAQQAIDEMGAFLCEQLSMPRPASD